MHRAAYTQIMKGTLTALLALAGCDKKGAQSAASPTAPAVPWQPHGLRVPTLRCDLTAPSGWSRHGSPMPDHIAELTSGDRRSVIIVGQRVEPELAAAREAALSYYRSGLLTAPGSALLSDAPLAGAAAPGHRLSLRSGPSGAGRIEAVIVLAFPGQPLVEIVARHEESDAAAADSVLSLARSLRCYAANTDR